MSIIFENVTKTIRGKTVLQGVTLSLETGRVTGLRGINGSGKTMLLRLLAGLIHPSEGKITIDGKTLESVSEEIYCLENGQLTDHLILREKGGSKP